MLSFNQFNELFGFSIGGYPYDEKAESIFKKMLDKIDTLQVKVYSDYKVEVTFRESENLDIKEAVEMRKFKGPMIKKIQTTGSNQESSSKSQSNLMRISAMKGQSSHRFSSKFWGNFKESSYILSVNGKTLVSKKKGEEGKPLVDPDISKIYYDFLTELGNLQEDKRVGLIDDVDYKNKLSKLKSKYSAKI